MERDPFQTPFRYGKQTFKEFLRMCQQKEHVKECAQVVAEKDCNMKYEENRVARMSCRAGTKEAKDEE